MAPIIHLIATGLDRSQVKNMDKSHHPRKKSRLNPHVPPHHKELVAALVTAVLLTALVSLFIIGGLTTKDYFDRLGKPFVIKTTATASPEPSKLDAKVLSVSYNDGEPGFEPLPDHRYIIVNVDVVHHLDKPTWLTPLLQSYMQSSNGEKYTLSPITIEEPFDARLYAIDEHGTGGLSYMVPKAAKNLKWCYEIAELSIKTCVPVR